MSTFVTSKVPPCYGLLFEVTDQKCMACLLNDECKHAYSQNENLKKTPRVSDTNVGQDIPKDKKHLILAVCKKFGIHASYSSKQDNRSYDVTEENIHEFTNLDNLITTKDALRKMLEY
jgi:hypothetical protein